MSQRYELAARISSTKSLRVAYSLSLPFFLVLFSKSSLASRYFRNNCLTKADRLRLLAWASAFICCSIFSLPIFTVISLDILYIEFGIKYFCIQTEISFEKCKNGGPGRGPIGRAEFRGLSPCQVNYSLTEGSTSRVARFTQRHPLGGVPETVVVPELFGVMYFCRWRGQSLIQTIAAKRMVGEPLESRLCPLIPISSPVRCRP